eukprot:7378074-Prymnesium_polylepis.1
MRPPRARTAWSALHDPTLGYTPTTNPTSTRPSRMARPIHGISAPGAVRAQRCRHGGIHKLRLSRESRRAAESAITQGTHGCENEHTWHTCAFFSPPNEPAQGCTTGSGA